MSQSEEDEANQITANTSEIENDPEVLIRGDDMSSNGVYFPLEGSRGAGCGTPLLVLSVFSAVFGSSTQFGYNLASLNNIESVIRSSLSNRDSSALVLSDSFSDVEWASAVAIFAIGGMFGAMCAGLVADLIGRKFGLMANNIVAVMGVVLQVFAVAPSMLIMGRFVIGVNAGANTVLAPLYISEISPLQYRGTMGVFNQLAITLTILASQLLGIHQVLGRSDSDHYGWRILLAVPLVFVVVQVVTLPFCPESPKYLYIKKKREEQAENELRKLIGARNYESELNILQEESDYATPPTSFLVTLKDFIVNPSLRRAVLLSIAVHLSQQITGIGGVLLYSTDIFKDSGIQNGDIATAVVGFTLFLGTIVTSILIDKVGRRTLMLYGLGGMFLFHSLVSAALCFQFAFYEDSYKYSLPGVLLILFTLCLTFSFAIGPGAIPWLVVSEFFQQATRPAAVSIATITNWSSNFVIGFVFPFMLQHLKPYPFVIFIAISAIFWSIMYFYLPETKGKTADEVAHYFQKFSEPSNSNCNMCNFCFPCNTRRRSMSSPIRIN